jgi:hypothetical protein
VVQGRGDARQGGDAFLLQRVDHGQNLGGTMGCPTWVRCRSHQHCDGMYGDDCEWFSILGVLVCAADAHWHGLLFASSQFRIQHAEADPLSDQDAEDRLKRMKYESTNLRYVFSLTVVCPACAANKGKECRFIPEREPGAIHQDRLNAAFDSVGKSQISQSAEDSLQQGKTICAIYSTPFPLLSSALRVLQIRGRTALVPLYPTWEWFIMRGSMLHGTGSGNCREASLAKKCESWLPGGVRDRMTPWAVDGSCRRVSIGGRHSGGATEAAEQATALTTA